MREGRLVTKAQKRTRESKLLMELQRDHGYSMSLMPEEGDQTGMLVVLPTSKTKKPGTMRAVRFVKLAVPVDSALGRALTKDARAARKRTPWPRPQPAPVAARSTPAAPTTCFLGPR